MNLAGRSVVVLGLARQGEACARALHAAGARVVVLDALDGPDQRERATRLPGVTTIFGRVDERDLGDATLIVSSAGVPPRTAWLKSAESGGIPVWSDIELAFRLGVAPGIAVTGTNGKTTTTEMVVAGLAAAGVDARAAGNIGAPIVDAREGMIVAEVSSFQLHAIETFRTPVSVLLNVAPDHIDWHGSFDAYVADKRNIFANQTADDVAIVHASCAHLHHGRSRLVTFDEDALPEQGAGIDDGWIVVPAGRVVPVTRLKVATRSARTDAIAAAAAACALGADPRAVGEGLAGYVMRPHRVEVIATIDDVTFINDSKATDPHATLAALEDLDRVVLIAGGRNKGLDLGALVEAAQRLRAVVAIGEAAHEIEEAFADTGVAVVIGDGMEDAVARARSLAHAGDTVLLSPACSSFDMFRDYEARGDAFRAAVISSGEERV